jgi:S1-C subfamily serine protease
MGNPFTLPWLLTAGKSGILRHNGISGGNKKTSNLQVALSQKAIPTGDTAMFTLPRILSLAVVLGVVAVPGPAQGSDRGGRKVYQKAVRSVVWIVRTDGTTGTGWVADADARLVVTNYHVVGQDRRVLILQPRFEDGVLVAERERYLDLKPLVGEVIQVDRGHDLAVIAVPDLPSDVEALSLATAEPQPGDTLHSIGNPARSGALWLYTSGTVRAVYSKEWEAVLSVTEILDLKARVIELQSPTNPGDSGGPVLDRKGHVVAVTQGFASDARLISYSISVFQVRGLLDEARPIARPTTAVEWERRGRFLEERGQRAEAIKAFETARTLAPCWPVPALRLATLAK